MVRPRRVPANTAAQQTNRPVGRVAVPARHGRPEIALGNNAGTIVHFVALNAGVIALVRPLSLDHGPLGLHLPVAGRQHAAARRAAGSQAPPRRLEGALPCTLYAAYVAASIAA